MITSRTFRLFRSLVLALIVAYTPIGASPPVQAQSTLSGTYVASQPVLAASITGELMGGRARTVQLVVVVLVVGAFMLRRTGRR